MRSTMPQPRPVGWRGIDLLQLILSALAVAAMTVSMWAALYYAPPASNLAGDEQLAQRIFYIHMGCNINARRLSDVGHRQPRLSHQARPGLGSRLSGRHRSRSDLRHGHHPHRHVLGQAHLEHLLDWDRG